LKNLSYPIRVHHIPHGGPTRHIFGGVDRKTQFGERFCQKRIIFLTQPSRTRPRAPAHAYPPVCTRLHLPTAATHDAPPAVLPSLARPSPPRSSPRDSDGRPPRPPPSAPPLVSLLHAGTSQGPDGGPHRVRVSSAGAASCRDGGAPPAGVASSVRRWHRERRGTGRRLVRVEVHGQEGASWRHALVIGREGDFEDRADGGRSGWRRRIQARRPLLLFLFSGWRSFATREAAGSDARRERVLKY
jgi:hypothetical protein